MARRRDDFLSSADDVVIDCRTFGHLMVEVGDYMNGVQVHVVMQCERCETYKIIQWSKSAGTIDGRKYRYSPGYINTTGEAVTKAEVRLEKIRRTKFKSLAEFDRLMTKIDAEMDSFRE